MATRYKTNHTISGPHGSIYEVTEDGRVVGWVHRTSKYGYAPHIARTPGRKTWSSAVRTADGRPYNVSTLCHAVGIVIEESEARR